MHKQRGIGALGVFTLLVLGVASAIILLKAIPPYLEFFSIKNAISALKSDAKSGDVREIKKKFDARATIDDIKSITGDDLEISKEGGEVVVSASYQKVVPLFANISLLIDFEASTQE